MTEEGKPTILLVDDDPQVVEVYVGYLQGLYNLQKATSGQEALEKITDETDVVLLDRRMPTMSGDEVVEAIREQGYDCRIALVTALTPEVEIVDMGIDDYLVKPVTRSKLRNVVDSLIRYQEYDEVLTEYFELARKAAALENRSLPAPLELSSEYQQLITRLSSLEAEAEAALEQAENQEDMDILDDLIRGQSTADNVESAGPSR